jgi:hypothetical protein
MLPHHLRWSGADTRALEAPMPIGIYPRRPLIDRFWKRVNKNGPVPPHCPELGPCWLWTGGQFRKRGQEPYGAICIDHQNHPAHRVAYELLVDIIPDSLFVCHHCDNTLCVRPSHLFVGTHTENMLDRQMKGRQAAGDRHWSRIIPERSARGEHHGNAKLTYLYVREIRALHVTGVPGTIMAKQFNVSRTTISRIVRGAGWVS